MKSIKEIEKLVKRFQAKPGPDMKSNVLKEALNIQILQKTSAIFTWKNIVGSRLTKFAAAASILVIFSSFIVLLDQLTKPVYAIEQTIQANDKIQTFHFKLYLLNDPNNSHREFSREAWVEYDKDGNVSKVRVDYYKSQQTEKTIQIWKDGGAVDWDKNINRIFIIRDKSFSDKILSFGQKFNPRGAIQYLHERQMLDEIKLGITKSPDKAQPITITADYPPNTYLLGKDKPAMRDVYFVDQATKLITSVEIYQLNDDGYSKLAIWRYEDYNQPFDDALFSIEDELPDDIIELYVLGKKDVGLKQGDLEEKEIAIKLATEFLNALIEKDYTKAGHLFGGMPDDQVEKKFGSLNIVQIISIDEPVKSISCYKISCSVGISNNGRILEWKPKDLYVRKAEGQDNYWIIVGGIN
ncbi:MAG: hypothetical protein P8016_00215 [Sedimentisphaerales bacterium]